MNEHHHSGGFFNGFVLGLLIGGGLVFLFGTSRGKKVLQMFLDQVEENTELSELLEIPDGEEDEYLMDDSPSAEEYSEKESKHTKKVDEDVEEIKPQHTVARVKRFFKGAPKKLVS